MSPSLKLVGSSAPCPRCTPGMRSYMQVTVAQFLYVPKLYVTVRANNVRFSSQIVTKPSPLEFPNCTTLIWDIMIPIVWFLHFCWQEIDGLLLPSKGTFHWCVMSHYNGLKITLSIQRKTRSYLQLLYIIEKLRYQCFTIPLVRSLGYCAERIQGDFLHAVSYGCK